MTMPRLITTPQFRFRQLPASIAVALVLAVRTMSLAAAPVADFSLPAAGEGQPFVLSEHRGHYVALHFLLKTECPFCLAHTRDYGRKAALLPDVAQVFIKPDDEAALREWTAKLPAGSRTGISLHRDPDAALAKQLGIPDGYAFHGELVHYPALILIDPAGHEVFRYVGRDNTDRFKFDQLAAKIEELHPNQALGEYNLPPDRVALDGHDPVAYFTDGRPRKGTPGLRARYRGVTYQFATQASLDQFLASPAKYLPTYGGWCATAMARGEKVEIDPANFKITNGRLFLFYKGLWGNALKDWEKDEARAMANADRAWKRIAGE